MLLLASVVLMTLDHRFHHLETVRTVLATALSPLQVLVALPFELGDWAGESFASRRHLLEENAELRSWQLQQQASLQKQAALEEENARLRRLLGASQRVSEEVMVGELLAVDVDPYRHQVVVNRGLRDGVHVEQPLLAAEGVMGQILHTSALTSTAILITDPSHALPVQVNRSGLRTVAFGMGETDRLSMPNVPLEADVRVGDVVVTSGLGNRFPGGYPVAVVTAIDREEGRTFARVEASPLAALDRGREVLLIGLPEVTVEGEEQREEQAAEADTDVTTEETTE